MRGEELIRWLVNECCARKIPPTDSAMILVLRELFDIEAALRTIRHNPEQALSKAQERKPDGAKG